MKSAKSRNNVSPVVMKFGGTSVENSEAIARVAEIVTSRKGHGRVVVVSALAKVTDQLVAMGQKASSGDCDASLGVSKEQRERHLRTAKSLLGSKLFPAIEPKIEATFDQLEDFLRGVAAVRELSPRSSDYLNSFGELISSEIVAAAFNAHGLDAVWVDSRKCVVTNNNHTRALPLLDLTGKEPRH